MRSGIYQYVRRVPLLLIDDDTRAPTVRQSLKTDDLALARLKRDAHERADDELWAALLSGGSPSGAKERYSAAIRRAEGLGFAYRGISELIAQASMEEVMGRVDALSGSPVASPQTLALLGLVDAPKVLVTEAFNIYCEEIMPADLVGKSEAQKRDWRKVKQRAVNNFIAVNGDIAISGITRDHARKFYKLWLDRIAPPPSDGTRQAPTHSASSGNRDVGNMRVLFADYHAHIGEPDRENPFAGFSFSEKVKRSRPPFSVEWMQKWFLRGTRLRDLNDEARGIVLMMIECGARPSELANLDENTIVLDHKIPHITIEPRDDPDDPREIKTASSVRKLPLVGVALAVAKKHSAGFPRYRNNESTLSATLNKMLRARDLLETPRHKVYSVRHAYEDRMKAAMFDEEMRRQIMGHAIDRPKYGSGFGLDRVQAEMKRIALPFDPAVV